MKCWLLVKTESLGWRVLRARGKDESEDEVLVVGQD